MSADNIFTVGMAIKAVLDNIGIYSDNYEDAFGNAVFERYIDKNVDISSVATCGLVRNILYKIYYVDKISDDITVLNEETAKEFIRSVTDEIIHNVFKIPTNRFRIHPMEHELSEDNSNTDRFLMDTGAGGAVINAPWKDGWNQNEENLEKLKSTAEMLRERKLTSWLYDEQVYPSGWANGYVDTPDDRYIGQNIGIATVMGAGRSNMTVALPENGMKFIKAYIYDYSGLKIHFDTAEEIPVGDTVQFEGRDGMWICLSFFIRRSNIWPYKWAKKLDPPIGPRKMLNFLDKEAVDKFLEGAFDVVAEKIGFLGDYFTATFTDEPALEALYQQGEKRRFAYESVPYDAKLFEFFKNKYGYDIKEKLPFLFFGETDEAKRTRVHYWSVIGDMIAKNFTGNYREKSHSYNMHFSGHLLGEETLFEHVGNYGNYMQAVSRMDYPGFDMLTGDNSQFWQRGTSQINSCIYAGSQSKLCGHNTTMVEICPVEGTDVFHQSASDNFEKVITSAIFGGATWINLYGYRFVNDNAKFNHMNEYVGRVCLFAATGVSDAKIGLYYPIEDMQAKMYEHTVEMYDLSDAAKELNTYFDCLHYYLFNNLIDFNIINSHSLAGVLVNNGSLNIKCTSYNAVIVPPMDMISLNSLKALKQFAENGGKVYFLEKLPCCCDEEISPEEFAKYIAGFEPIKLGLGNIAFRADATASHVCDGYSTEPVTNGSTATAFCFDGWSSDKLPATVDISFNKRCTFNHIELYSTEQHEQSGYKAQYFDGEKWKTLCEVDNNVHRRMDGDFEDISTDKLRLVFEKGCKSDANIARLNEIEVFYLHHSNNPCEFTKELWRLTENTVTVTGAMADTLRMRRVKMNGENCYFIVNIATKAQKLQFASEKDVEIRLYDPMNGEFTDAKGTLTYEVESGKAVFVIEKG